MVAVAPLVCFPYLVYHPPSTIDVVGNKGVVLILAWQFPRYHQSILVLSIHLAFQPLQCVYHIISPLVFWQYDICTYHIVHMLVPRIINGQSIAFMIFTIMFLEKRDSCLEKIWLPSRKIKACNLTTFLAKPTPRMFSYNRKACF